MTIQEIESSDKVFLLAKDVCGLLGVNAQSIRVAAKQRPELLGFPVTVVGVNVFIPRIPFMEFVGIKRKSPAEAEQRKIT